jgi:hypothetical protein
MGRKHSRGGMLCSEILDLHLQSKSGKEHEVKVNLEEIWASGAVFLTDEPIRPFTSLWFAGAGCEFRGQAVSQTLSRGLGYFIEMQFDPGCAWSERDYRPKHHFNPLVALANRIFEGTLHAPSGPSGGLCTFARTAAVASFKQAPGQAF